jgi:enoyl-CoA hydratase
MTDVAYEPAGEGVVEIRLRRPEKLNALDLTTWRSLCHAIRRAADDVDVRVVIFSGEGRAFCSGYDFKQGESGPANWLIIEDSVKERSGQYLWLDTVRTLRRPDKVFIAAVHGWTAGAGLELAVASDFIVADESTRFYFAETKIGANFTSGMSKLLPQLVGLGQARRLTLLGETIDAAEAHRIGLTFATAPAGKQRDEAMALARRLTAMPPLALVTEKRLLETALDMSMPAVQDAEVQAAALLGHTQDAVEAATAFAERRPPVFTGR